MKTLKVVAVFLSAIMACNSSPVWDTDWDVELPNLFSSFETLWASGSMTTLVENLFMCDLVVMGPGGNANMITGSAGLIDLYTKAYTNGMTVWTLDSLEQIFPSGPFSAVAWVKYTSVHTNPAYNYVGRAMVLFVNHWGTIKIQMLTYVPEAACP